MRYLIKTLSTVFLTLFLLFPFSSRLQAHSIVLLATDYPPYEFAEPEGGLRGFDLEVIEAAFNRVQISPEFKFYPWKRVVEKTKLGLAAGMFSCRHRPDIDEFVYYSNPISNVTTALFVRHDFDGSNPTDLQELKGQSVATVLGWGTAVEMEKAGVEFDTYRSELLVFRNLLKGVFDYAYLTLESSGFIAKKLGISKDLRTIAIHERAYTLCFSKKWPGVEEIVQKFNEGLAAVRADGTYDAIHDKYR